MSKRTVLPLAERIKRTKDSMAMSPADAARKVTAIGKAIIADLMTDEGKSPGILPPGPRAVDTYCAVLRSNANESLRRENKDPCEAALGNPVANTIVSLAFILATVPERFARGGVVPPAYYDLRMTLGDYLDALIDLSFGKDGMLDSAHADHCRELKKEFSEICDLSKPLCRAIGDILAQYGRSRAKLGRASHIIKCAAECDSRVRDYEQEREMLEEYRENDYFYKASEINYSADCEENPEETGGEMIDICPASFVTEEGLCFREDPENRREREELMAREQLIEYDPHGYFLAEAKRLPEDGTLDFENRTYGLGKLSELLLSEDYSPEALKDKADQAELSPEFRALFDEAVTEERVLIAFKEIDAAVDRLYRLIVEPFSIMGLYRFKRHIAGEG